MLKELIKEILKEEFSTTKKSETKSSITCPIGLYVMIRTYSSGVQFGILEEVSSDYDVVKLSNARRVHYWSGACSLSQLAMEGAKKLEECRISVPVQEIILQNVIEIIPMTKDAVNNLSSVVWKS